jgi:hypothetical protein
MGFKLIPSSAYKQMSEWGYLLKESNIMDYSKAGMGLIHYRIDPDFTSITCPDGFSWIKTNSKSQSIQPNSNLRKIIYPAKEKALVLRFIFEGMKVSSCANFQTRWGVNLFKNNFDDLKIMSAQWNRARDDFYKIWDKYAADREGLANALCSMRRTWYYSKGKIKIGTSVAITAPKIVREGMHLRILVTFHPTDLMSLFFLQLLLYTYGVYEYELCPGCEKWEEVSEHEGSWDGHPECLEELTSPNVVGDKSKSDSLQAYLRASEPILKAEPEPDDDDDDDEDEDEEERPAHSFDENEEEEDDEDEEEDADEDDFDDEDEDEEDTFENDDEDEEPEEIDEPIPVPALKKTSSLDYVKELKRKPIVEKRSYTKDKKNRPPSHHLRKSGSVTRPETTLKGIRNSIITEAWKKVKVDS